MTRGQGNSQFVADVRAVLLHQDRWLAAGEVRDRLGSPLSLQQFSTRLARAAREGHIRVAMVDAFREKEIPLYAHNLTAGEEGFTGPEDSVKAAMIMKFEEQRDRFAVHLDRLREEDDPESADLVALANIEYAMWVAKKMIDRLGGEDPNIGEKGLQIITHIRDIGREIKRREGLEARNRTFSNRVKLE